MFGFRLESIFKIPGVLIVISGIGVGVLLSGMDISLSCFRESGDLGVNTDWNWRFRMFALVVLSECSLPWSWLEQMMSQTCEL